MNEQNSGKVDAGRFVFSCGTGRIDNAETLEQRAKALLYIRDRKKKH